MFSPNKTNMTTRLEIKDDVKFSNFIYSDDNGESLLFSMGNSDIDTMAVLKFNDPDVIDIFINGLENARADLISFKMKGSRK